MRKVPFGKTGLDVSVLGFGAAPIGYLDTERERVARILNLMLDAGVNLIDTASNYPGSEEAIADTVGHRRGEYVLVSKCGPKLPDLEERAWSPELIGKTAGGRGEDPRSIPPGRPEARLGRGDLMTGEMTGDDRSAA